MLNFVKWSSIASDWSSYKRDVHCCSCPCPILIECRWNARGRQLIKRDTVLSDLHARFRKWVKEKVQPVFVCLFFLFACSSEICGYRRNETLLLEFDIVSNMTKNLYNKKQLANFFMVIRILNLTIWWLPSFYVRLTWRHENHSNFLGVFHDPQEKILRTNLPPQI